MSLCMDGYHKSMVRLDILKSKIHALAGLMEAGIIETWLIPKTRHRYPVQFDVVDEVYTVAPDDHPTLGI